jgi:hypothetical protein
MKPHYTMALNHYGLGKIKDLDKDLELGVVIACYSSTFMKIVSDGLPRCVKKGGEFGHRNQ